MRVTFLPITILDKLVQFLKASCPILSTLLPMLAETKLLHLMRFVNLYSILRFQYID